ncbi:MAG: type 2 isopentenyl-diphosphate Delta-isomerase, partial [Candidatus Nitrosothermus koennekii]
MHYGEIMSEDKDIEIIKQRKRDALNIPLQKEVQYKETTTLLEYVTLIHNALPELNLDEIDTSTTFLNHKFNAPIIIDSMTGGAEEAREINSRLAEVAEEYNIGMGLGSQRAGLLSKELEDTYSIAREKAPHAFLIANIGAAQLAKGLSIDDIKSIIDMIKANALAIHLNPLQELVQPEGEPMFKGVYDKISEVIRSVNIPVIVKEVGSGISKEVAVKLEIINV